MNLDNFLISTVGLHPGIFLKKDKKKLCNSSALYIHTNVVHSVVIYTQNVRDLYAQSCSVFLHQMRTLSAKFNIKPNN